MNQLVAKEARGIAPSFLTAMALAIIPVWLFPENAPAADVASYTFGLFCFGALVMALTTFGREFGMGTFPLLLALPIKRSRIWWTKIALLAFGLAIVFAAGIFCSALWNFQHPGHMTWIREFGGPMPLVTTYLLIFSSGLWTTLLLRQIVAAFWFSVLIPAACLTILLSLSGSQPVAELVLCVYSAVGFVAAWIQFNRAQEVGWTGGEVNLPEWQIDDASSRPANRQYQPMKAMLWKEAQLYQVALAGMAALFVVHLGVVIVRKVMHAGEPNSILAGLLDMFGGIWLIVPVFTAGLNVAEERRLGTMEAQLCLPVSTGRQFWVKLGMTVALSGVLSALLVWIAEGFATAIGTFGGIGGMKISLGGEGLLSLLIAFTILSLLTFYASTLSRNILQTLAVAVVTAAVLGLIWAFAIGMRRNSRIWLWDPGILSVISWPVIAGTIIWLGYTNYRRLSQTGRLWRRNISTLALAMVGSGLLTTLIFNRAWEYLTPIEPAHGPRQLRISQAPILHAQNAAVSALLPDGRLWWDTLFYLPPRWTIRLSKDVVWNLDEDKWVGSQGNHFLEGTNWAGETCAWRETVGIQSDGSLWVSQRPMGGTRVPAGRPVPTPVNKLVRMGDANDWKSVARSAYGVTLLKTDGSLWALAENPSGKGHRNGLAGLTPRRIGTDSDWTDMVAMPNGAMLWKNDGTSWSISSGSGGNRAAAGQVEDPDFIMMRWEPFDNLRWRSLAMAAIFGLAVRDDGTLWTFGQQPGHTDYETYSQRTNAIPKKPVQIGTANDWVAVMGNFQMLVALKRDGTLWKWSTGYYWTGDDWIPFHPPTQLGTQNDWVAISGEPNGTQTLAAMAADGSIWNWSSGFNYGSWLRPSRKPEFFANVLTEK